MLDAASHECQPLASDDCRRRLVDGLEPGPAETVHRDAANRDRKAREQSGHPCDVAVVLASLVGCSEVDVLQQARVDSRATDRLGDHLCREIIGPDTRKRASMTTDGGSHRRDQDRDA